MNITPNVAAIAGGAAGWLLSKSPLWAAAAAYAGYKFLPGMGTAPAENGLGMIHMLAGLGSTPQIRGPFDFSDDALVAEGAFRCPPGQVAAVGPSGEVVGCKAAPLMTAGGMSWLPWVVGLGAVLLLAGTVFAKPKRANRRRRRRSIRRFQGMR